MPFDSPPRRRSGPLGRRDYRADPNPYARLFAPDPREGRPDEPGSWAGDPAAPETCYECGYPVAGGRCRCPGGSPPEGQ